MELQAKKNEQQVQTMMALIHQQNQMHLTAFIEAMKNNKKKK